MSPIALQYHGRKQGLTTVGPRHKFVFRFERILENRSSSCEEVIRMSGHHGGLARRPCPAVVPIALNFCPTV